MTSKTVTHYKIRCSKTGLFSPGGGSAYKQWQEGRWSKKTGKVWTSMGALKNHLNQMIYNDYGYGRFGAKPGPSSLVCEIPPEWEIVEIQIVVNESEANPIKALDLMRSRIDTVKKEVEESNARRFPPARC